MSESSGTLRSAVSAWLELLRIPNLPGVAGNVLVGFLLVAGSWQPGWAVALTISAALSFYVAGLIGNDLADIELDKKRKPDRPLASGRISAAAARIAMGMAFAEGLLGCGMLCGNLSSMQGTRPLQIGAGLSVAILAYNFWLKRWLVSALFMGLCRGLTVLLGAAVASLHSEPPAGTGWSVQLLAVSLTLFVAGLTLVARDEAAARPRRWVVVTGLLAQVAGLAGYLLLPRFLSGEAGAPGPWFDGSFSVLIAAIAFTVLRRGVMAAWSTNPRAIRTAVLISLVSITTLDAAVAWLATGQLVSPVMLLGLLGVSLIFREFASPT